MKNFLIILLIFVTTFCLFPDDATGNEYIDPMVYHWNGFLFSECSGYDWWQINASRKSDIINAIVSTIEIIEEYLELEIESFIPEIGSYFKLMDGNLAINFAKAIDKFYEENRIDEKYETKAILLIISIYKQWKNGLIENLEEGGLLDETNE